MWVKFECSKVGFASESSKRKISLEIKSERERNFAKKCYQLIKQRYFARQRSQNLKSVKNSGEIA